MTQDMSLQGKIAIVTGASRGIGAAIAELLASRGANIVLGYGSPSSAELSNDLAAKLHAQHGGNHLPIQADLSEATAAQHLIDTAKHHYTSSDPSSPFTISILINNAGVAPWAELGTITEADFLQPYRINVLAPLLLTQATAPHLPHDKTGRIVNVSSVSSALGAQGQSVYAGSKAALEAMTRVWARELAARATVNAVSPGPVATDALRNAGPALHKLAAPFVALAPLAEISAVRDGGEMLDTWGALGGRPAELGEVAGVVGMLCSSDARWCTGSVVCANGGMKFTS